MTGLTKDLIGKGKIVRLIKFFTDYIYDFYSFPDKFFGFSTIVQKIKSSYLPNMKGFSIYSVGYD